MLSSPNRRKMGCAHGVRTGRRCPLDRGRADVLVRTPSRDEREDARLLRRGTYHPERPGPARGALPRRDGAQLVPAMPSRPSALTQSIAARSPRYRRCFLHQFMPGAAWYAVFLEHGCPRSCSRPPCHGRHQRSSTPACTKSAPMPGLREDACWPERRRSRSREAWTSTGMDFTALRAIDRGRPRRLPMLLRRSSIAPVLRSYRAFEHDAGSTIRGSGRIERPRTRRVSPAPRVIDGRDGAARAPP